MLNRNFLSGKRSLILLSLEVEKVDMEQRAEGAEKLKKQEEKSRRERKKN